MTRSAPSLIEIFSLPWLGIGLAWAGSLYVGELQTLFLPFLVVVIRMYLMGLTIPDVGAIDSAAYIRSVRNCRALEQGGLFFLAMFEFVGVVALSPAVPAEVWLVVLGFYGIYVLQRLGARYYWGRAASAWRRYHDAATAEVRQ